MTLSVYLQNACDMLHNWSVDRQLGGHAFNHDIHIKDKCFVLADQWLLNNAEINRLKGSDRYLCTFSEHVRLINTDVSLCLFKTKPDFNMLLVNTLPYSTLAGIFCLPFVTFCYLLKETFSKVFVVSINRENWPQSSCSCSYFSKKYFCYHIVGVSVHLKLANIPARLSKIPIGNKPKRGRKPKAQPALIRQNIL